MDRKGEDRTELAITGQEAGSDTAPFRHRRDGFTPLRQRTFLRALAETGCVKQACARVRLSTTSAYRVRQRIPEFARAWDQALEIISPILEHAAYERGVEGWEEPVFHGGKIVGQRGRYSDAMLRLLIQRGATPATAQGKPEDLIATAQAAAKRAGGLFSTVASMEEVEQELLKRLGALDRRLKREAEQARAAALGPIIEG